MLAFCNNCGPAFILGVVGTGIFGSGRAGLVLYFAHLAASLLIGLLFRFYRPEEGPRRWRQAGPQFQATSFPAAFTRSVTGALQSTLNICAFILFFTVAIRIFTFSGLMSTSSALLSTLLSPFGLSQQWAQKLLTGLLEMSSGVSSLTEGALTGRLSMPPSCWAGQECRPLPGHGLSGGQRPVPAHLCGREVAPRRSVRRPHRRAALVLSPGNIRRLLPGGTDRGHCYPGLPPCSHHFGRLGLGDVAGLFCPGSVCAKKKQWKKGKICIIIWAR